MRPLFKLKKFSGAAINGLAALEVDSPTIGRQVTNSLVLLSIHKEVLFLNGKYIAHACDARVSSP
ncbi:MAG: hypothetical protein L6Q78_13585 [Bacteroidia bacterium]|nr:hypothetical protein [Bacteroidia bacterium]